MSPIHEAKYTAILIISMLFFVSLQCGTIKDYFTADLKKDLEQTELLAVLGFMLPSTGTGTGTGTTGTTSTDTTAPANVAGITATPGNGQAVLTWTDPADGDFDHVEITWSPGGTAIISVAKGSQTYTVTRLTNGTAYTFTIKAVDASGNKSSGAVSGSTTPVIGKLPKKTGQTQCWDTAGTLDAACTAGTSAGQDGKLQIGTSPSYTGPTLVGASDYITKDNVTGLIWKSCTEGFSGATCGTSAGLAICPTTSAADQLCTWDEAFLACNALNSANAGSGYAGRKNWRLPTIDDLQTIIDRSKASGAAIDLTYFPASLANVYWSSSIYIANTTDAWRVHFASGEVLYYGKTFNYYVRCVSTGP